MENNSLENRMKSYEELSSNFLLSKRGIYVLRLDGKAFKNYTKGLNKPFDRTFHSDMLASALLVFKEVQGAILAETHSDEISIVFSNLTSERSEQWFGGNIQKITSVSASIASAKLNSLRSKDYGLAYFDSRIFELPYSYEVVNYLIWRQNDSIRNSINSLARCHYSHKELVGLNNDVVKEKLLKEKNINWDKIDASYRLGTFIYKKDREIIIEVPPILTDVKGEWFNKNIPAFNLINS